MPNFYVPVVLVVEGETMSDAIARSGEIVRSLIYLEPAGINGDVYPEGLRASPASDQWFDKDHALSSGNDNVEVVEV